ncbi:uncharacterized protein LOC116615300 [Nematostella vectensis]|uniref:uncharacterized protein LOC116615300 n=1 Tax=Nematostella vectensis TaxID=45351 RepID=UPI0020776CA8|nr:uncharacterized protein LOC116615300 [Nematostella vectensis]
MICTLQGVLGTPTVNLDGEEGTKTLGVGWNPQRDTISFASRDLKLKALTKRSVLSSISQLYDPLGLASAVTIKARVALQEVWRAEQFDWDDPLPEETTVMWLSLLKEIVSLKEVQIPRCLKPHNAGDRSELHVFADASCKAYGAVAYLVWPTPQGPEVRIVAAKARVAPLRQSTVPRLELMAALVASRLAKTIVSELKTKPESVVLWSDSTIVLSWLRSRSSAFKPFVGVLIAEIQSEWEQGHWRHVPTDQNLADDLSRCITVEELSKGRWMSGPPFLKKPRADWPIEAAVTQEEEDPERKKETPVSAIAAAVQEEPLLDPQSQSRWSRLVRITAYCMRFVSNLKSSVKNPEQKKTSHLAPAEIEAAEEYWLRFSQRAMKTEDYPNL